MDKLKKVFSPGSKKDDEVLYGDADARSRSAEKAQERTAEQLHPVEGSDKKEHGVLRQVLNPGGDKYDEQRFGDTATTQPPDPNLLQTDPEAEKKDHTIIRQILNPAGDKYDEQRFGATAHTGGDGRTATIPTRAPQSVSPETHLETDPSHKDHSILRQIINPHGQKYDEEAFGQTARASTSGPSGSAAVPESATTQKDSSITRQILNPGHEKYDPVVHGSSSAAGQDSALAGGLVGAGASSQQGKPSAEPRRQGPITTTTTTTTTSTVGPTVTRHTVQSRPAQTAQAYGAPQAVGDNSHIGRDGTVAGGLVAAGSGPAQGSTASGAVSENNMGRNSGLAGGLVGAGAGTGVSQSMPGQTAQAHGAPQTIGDNSHVGRDGIIAGGLAAAGAGAGAAYTGSHNSQANQPPRSTAMTDRAHPLDDRERAGQTHINPVGAPEFAAPATNSEAGTSGSHLGRDAGLASGVGAAGLGAGALATESGSVMDRSHPLSGVDPDSSGALGSSSTHVGASSGGHINPIGEPEQSLQGGSHAQAIHDAAAVGGAGGAGLAGGSAARQLNTAPDDVQGATYTYRSYGLASGEQDHVDTPHVPGEFPLETGEDPHEVRASGVRAGDAAGIAGGPGSTAGRSIDDEPIHTVGQRYDTAHLGRDAAIGAGAGVGAGAVASSLSPTPGTQQSTAATTHPGGQSYPVDQPAMTSAQVAATGNHPDEPNHGPRAAMVAGETSAVSQPDMTSAQVTATSEQAGQHHYGREAAVAGGATAAAGVAGYGIYEGSQTRGDTGPASGTIGPHESNVANVLDPRVQPEPEKMKNPTVGPHQTDMANRLDPRVTSDPAKAAEKAREQGDTHYGRDAAIAGGAGAAAAGGYAAIRDQDKSGPPSQYPTGASSEMTSPTYPATAPATADSRRAEGEAESHRGRDAAAVAGTAGVTGAGAYGAEKLHDETQEKKLQQEREEAQKQQEKQQKKAEKERDEAQKEHEKQQKKAQKEREEAEKEKEKQQKKAQKEREEAEEDKEKEKKPSLIHRILHPGEGKDKDKAEDGEDNRTSLDEHGHHKLHKKSVEQPHHDTSDQRVIEPHTGLPMDLSKGTGAGGTDGAQQIPGYHETDPAIRGASVGTAEGAGTKQPHPQPGEEGVAGPDWDAIKKANTPY